MYGANFALIVNTIVAGLFSASFAVIALANPSYRKALWFGASYGVGMLTPFSLLIMPHSRWPMVFGALNYASFSAGLLMMSGALAIFYDRHPRWTAISCVFLLSLVNGQLISGWPQNMWQYNLSYQMPFAIAAAMSAGVILQASRREPLELALASLYCLIAVHFVIKSFLAVAFGASQLRSEYATSVYALISQSFTGVLLVAAGLLTLLIVAQSAIADARRAAETDQLTGLLNRRGFDLHCGSRLSWARKNGRLVTVMLLDLDYFKQINDRFGHATGDEVLKDFAALLKGGTPQNAIVGRMGGEEFVAFLDGATLENGQRFAEAVRRAAALRVSGDLPPITVSIGVAGVRSEETFSDAMRRADKALYKAKAMGRNRVCIAD
jgi:diguanylate cyclase (GGDEF)-like protein